MPDQSRQNQAENNSTKDPYTTIASFCQDYDLSECQTLIWQILAATLSSEDADLWDKQERGNTVFFCRNIDALIRAAFEINQQRTSS